MTAIYRIDAARRQWNVLDHPFYERWSAGTLERSELAFYAGEYRHAVVALAEATERAAEAAAPAVAAELSAHAAEEGAHISLWDAFGGELEASTERPPRAETSACADAWTAGDDLLERLAVLYAVEASQPAISQAKLDGLIEHYAMQPEGPATAYFRVHAERDHDHAAHSRALIESLACPEDAERLAARAEAALAANWRLLDGVEERFGRDAG